MSVKQSPPTDVTTVSKIFKKLSHRENAVLVLLNASCPNTNPILLSVSLNRACASRNHFFLSPDFHELWCSVMSICLLTEVKQQWATLVLGWVTV